MSMYGSRKRKRGSGAAVLQAAQHGGDPDRAAYVRSLQAAHPRPASRVAQSSLFVPVGRSGIRHLKKKGGERSDNKPEHVHDLMRKYYRGKPTNGIKSYIRTYAQTG